MKIHQRAIVDFFKTLKPGRLLDAGSGGGLIGDSLHAMGFDVVSLDLYERPKGGVPFVKADLNATLPFKDEVFDYILCSESLQYLENHARLLREFKMALRPGGSVVLSFPNVLNAPSRLYFLRRGYYPNFKPIRRVEPSVEWDIGVYNPLSFVDVYGLAKETGLEIVTVASSQDKPGGRAAYLLLKALYSAGLLFEKNEKKAELIRVLSSREVLLGDHLIIRLAKPAGKAD